MVTLKIDVDDKLARHIEDCARRERKSISEWISERVQPETERALALASMEARARANGYPTNWLSLFGSLADDETFAAPARTGTKPVATWTN
jgi:hypothetical protein